MTAQSSVPTDYNPGSNVRTLEEAQGSVIEMQATSDAALAFQALAYGAMSLFGVRPRQATPATGTVIFATSFPLASSVVAPQAVFIPSGTLVQTPGGAQFATIGPVTLASGTTNVTAGIIAVLAGTAGNVPASGISGVPLTSVGYPLFASNGIATTGGTNAGSQSLALAQFTAKSQSLGLASPVAVANAPIGVTVTGTGETVNYAACFEPWIYAGSGAGSGTAGFTLYIDNGTGGASPALISAVQSWITGNSTLDQSGYRPLGVPYAVSAVTPVYATVIVSGTLIPGLLTSGNVINTVTSGVTSYFNSINISAPSGTTYSSGAIINTASQPQIAGRVADTGFGSFSSLAVNLYYTASSGSTVPVVSGGIGTRVILSTLLVAIG